jgi:hypothetical protein
MPSSLPDESAHRLREELVAERSQMLGVQPHAASERLRSAADTVRSIEMVVVKGKSVAATVLEPSLDEP